MYVNIEREDARNAKTLRALHNAMFSLLARQKFNKITVRDICNEASISRATFYAHFDDKYDFLKNWLLNVLPKDLEREDTVEATNNFIHGNKKIIKNIVSGASDETLNILLFTIMKTLKLEVAADDFSSEKTRQILLSNIIAGGLVYHLIWLTRNNFPPAFKSVDTYLLDIINSFYKTNV